MTFVVFLHVAAAIFTIGPLTVATAASPAVIAKGDAGLAQLRWLHRTTRIYGAISIVVFLLGLALVPLAHASFGKLWVTASMTLYVVAIGLLYGLVERDQRKAIEQMTEGEAATVKAGRIRGVSAAIAVIWLVILLLMFFKPGN